MAEVMGRADLVSDPDTLSLASRVQRRSELDNIIAEWVKDKTMAELQALMDNAGLPCAP